MTRITIVLRADVELRREEFLRGAGEAFRYTPQIPATYQGYSIFESGRLIVLDRPLSITVPAQDVTYVVQFQRAVTVPPPPEPQPQPIPQPPNVQKWGTVGTRCDLIKWSSGMAEWFAWRNRYTGEQGQPVTDHTVAIRMGEASAGCNIPLPGSAEGWFGDVQKTLQNMFGSISETISGVASRLSAVEDFVHGFWDRLEGWLVERIIGIIWKALTAEKKDGT